MTKYYYYRVRNDVIKQDPEGSPTWTDEPLWLRKEIDTWDRSLGGGRFYADQNAQYSYIISPKELISPVGDDLIELTEQQILLVIEQAFPPQTITNEGEPDTIVPSPSLSRVCSTWWGYATNHTGNITTNETWALADNDHHITGNITLSANVILTIAAGVNVYYDGNYAINRTAGSGGTTTVNAVGTSELPITFEANQSRTGTAQNNTVGSGIGGANNCATTLQYCNIANFSTFLTATNYTSFATTLDHLNVRDSVIFVTNTNATTIPTINISNSRFMRMTQSAISFGTVTTNSAHTLTDCEWRSCLRIMEGSKSGAGSVTLTFNDCAFLDKTLPGASSTMPQFTWILNRCLHDCTYMDVQTSGSLNLTDTIVTKNTTADAILIRNSVVNNTYITTSDIMGHGASTSLNAVSNASTVPTSAYLTSCYISGWKGADIFNYYTGSETPAQTTKSNNGSVVFVTPSTTRNFPFTQSSIAASGITSNAATVSWTGLFRTMNRLAVGTVSGTYATVYTKNDTWTDYDGKGKMTASPSFALAGLSSSTTYYYVCQSWDWARSAWNQSAENSFTTLPSQPISYGSFN